MIGWSRNRIVKKIIHLKNIISEDFVNYRYPSMFLITAHCNWKCCTEANISITECQNQPLVNVNTKSFFIEDIIGSYLKNDITKAVVFGGLEPFLQFNEMLDFIEAFREKSNDEIIIYTGYYKDELMDEIEELRFYKNIIIKFGRFIPDQEPHFDEVLGVNLCSANQYAESIS